MNGNGFRKVAKSGFGAILLFFTSQIHALASGTVTVPDEAHLRAALAGGGLVTLACDGTIALANTLIITNDTTVDASGQSVTISGNNTVRVFTVDTPITLH